jgi:hypothetical protein
MPAVFNVEEGPFDVRDSLLIKIAARFDEIPDPKTFDLRFWVEQGPHQDRDANFVSFIRLLEFGDGEATILDAD